MSSSHKTQSFNHECVVLLHGLGRTSRSMNKLASYLDQQGYQVVNTSYPSRKKFIIDIANQDLPPIFAQCEQLSVTKIHVVTHSMGGIVLRAYLMNHQLPKGSRIVMLSPPNKGSELADALKNNLLFKKIQGPAGQELGTQQTTVTELLPQTIADYEVGIITGDKNLNPITNRIFKQANDGKVSVESAKLKGMRDFLVVHHNHSFIMKSKDVKDQVNYFLKHGCFMRKN